MKNKLVDIEIKPVPLKEGNVYNCLLWCPVYYLRNDKIMLQTADIDLYTEPTEQYSQYITTIGKRLYFIVAYEE